MRRDNSTRDLFEQVIAEHLPPRASWPDLVYATPELDYPAAFNLAEALLAPSRIDPRKTAIHFRAARISYEWLRRRMLRLSAGLIRLGVRPGDRVALRLPNGPDFVAAWLALQWIGAIAVQMPPLYRRREIDRVVSHSGATVVLCARELSGDLEAVCRPRDVRVIGVDDLPCDSAADPAPFPTPRDAPAVITYISCADGPLRGVVHSPADFLAAADAYARGVLGLEAADVCIGAAGLSWAFGLGALLVFPLRAGATAAFAEGPAELLDAIAASRATVLFGVPTIYRILLGHPKLGSSDLTSLRCCVSAAEPLSADVAEQWRARTGVEILDGLGTTELTHIFVSARSGQTRPGFVGTPVAGYDARIVDRQFRELPDGTAGELAVRGPTGARYWRDPEAQCRTVRHGWTLTGDICVRHPGGWLQHVRRADTLIVSAGYKISIREVEDALNGHPDVSEARVFGVPDPVRGAVASAVVTPEPRAERSTLAERLQQYLKTELAPFKCPRTIRIQ